MAKRSRGLGLIVERDAEAAPATGPRPGGAEGGAEAGVEGAEGAEGGEEVPPGTMIEGPPLLDPDIERDLERIMEPEEPRESGESRGSREEPREEPRQPRQPKPERDEGPPPPAPPPAPDLPRMAEVPELPPEAPAPPPAAEEELPTGPPLEFRGKRKKPPAGLKPTPVPPYRLYSTSSAASDRKPAELFKWLTKLPREYQCRLLLYVYRLWPLIDNKRADENLPRYIGKVPGEDPFTSEQSLLRLWGSGNYKIIITDSVYYGGSICECYVTGLQDRDYPPVIRPLAALLLNEKENRGFIEGLRERGIKLPGDAGYREEYVDDDGTVHVYGGRDNEEDGMQQGPGAPGGATKSMEVIADLLKDTHGRLMERAEGGGEGKAPEAVAVEAARAGIALVQQSAQAQMEMLRDGMRKQEPETGLAMLDAVVKTATKLVEMSRPPDREAGLIGDLLRSMREQAEKEQRSYVEAVNRLTLEIGQIRAQQQQQQQQQTAAPAGGTAPKSFVDQLEDFARMQRSLKKLTGTEEDGGGGAGGGTDWVAGLMQHLPLILTAGSLIMTNFAAARAGVPPQPVPAALFGGLGEPEPEENETPSEETNEMNIPVPNAMNQALKLIQDIQDPLINHWNRHAPDWQKGKSSGGYEFARWFVEGKGETFYGQVAQAAPEQLKALILANPHLARMAQEDATRFHRFVEDFLNYRQLREQRRREKQRMAESGNSSGSAAPEPGPEAA